MRRDVDPFTLERCAWAFVTWTIAHELSHHFHWDALVHPYGVRTPSYDSLASPSPRVRAIRECELDPWQCDVAHARYEVCPSHVELA
jgi:hypothetical protein